MRLSDDVHVNSHTVHAHVDIRHHALVAWCFAIGQIYFFGKVLVHFLLLLDLGVVKSLLGLELRGCGLEKVIAGAVVVCVSMILKIIRILIVTRSSKSFPILSFAGVLEAHLRPLPLAGEVFCILRVPSFLVSVARCSRTSLVFR